MEDFIIIGFSKPKKFKLFSWLICKFEKTEYSHVYIKSYNKHFNDHDIYQASKGFVNHLIDATFFEENSCVKEFKVPCNNKLEVIEFIRRKLGKPYSIKSLVIIFLKRCGIDLTRFSDGEKAYICSELGARVINYNKINNIQIQADLITPKQLFDIVEKITN